MGNSAANTPVPSSFNGFSPSAALMEYDDSTEVNVEDVPFDFGERVVVTRNFAVGTIRYIGTTHFAPGLWYGVELDKPGLSSSDAAHLLFQFVFSLVCVCTSLSEFGVCAFFVVGKNDGIVENVTYFRCSSRHGLFCRASGLMSYWNTQQKVC